MGIQRVLVARNDLSSAEELCGHLRSRGYDADAGQDAFSLAQKIQLGTPDLIILDFQLAGGDGPTIVERLRGNTRTLAVRVVFLVGGDPPAAQARFANPDKLYLLPNTAPPAVPDALIGRLLGPPRRASPSGGIDDPDQGPTVPDLDA